MSLALSKTLDPADLIELAPELTIVDKHFTSASEQHPMRRWEYAMALRAHQRWAGQGYQGMTAYDVGGAGSPFAAMIDEQRGRNYRQTRIIDPEVNRALADLFREPTVLGDCVFCLSVLEHVENLDEFLYHLSCLTAPGGLLFLTMDYTNELHNATGWPPDQFHFHWMRQRIANPWALGRYIAGPLLQLGFGHLGDMDLTYNGDQVYNYSFASLALVKRR